MAWLEIIGLIMQIIQFIMGIFVPPTPPNAIHTQYSCANVRWTQAPKMVNGELVGTASQSCSFEGRSGGGLTQLKQHLVNQVEKDASVVYAGPVQTVSNNGESTTQYSVAFNADSESGEIQTRGSTTLVASANRLRHSYNQTAVYAKNDAQSLSGVKADMDITPAAQAHWYNVTTTTSIRVKKPWFVSGSYFQSKIAGEIEKQMPGKVIDAINDMASHL